MNAATNFAKHVTKSFKLFMPGSELLRTIIGKAVQEEAKDIQLSCSEEDAEQYERCFYQLFSQAIQEFIQR